MIRFEPTFLRGLLTKAVMLALLAGGCAAVAGGWWAALSTVLGVAVFCGDIIAIAWLLRKMLEPGQESAPGAGLLSLLFLLKLLVLFGLTYYLLAVVGLDPLGFVAGCMFGLGALSWQVIATTPEDDGEPDSDVAGESPAAEEE